VNMNESKNHDATCWHCGAVTPCKYTWNGPGTDLCVSCFNQPFEDLEEAFAARRSAPTPAATGVGIGRADLTGDLSASSPSLCAAGCGDIDWGSESVRVGGKSYCSLSCANTAAPDPYTIHRGELVGKGLLNDSSVRQATDTMSRNERARLRNVTALAREMDQGDARRASVQRHPHEGRSCRVYRSNREP